MSAQEKNENTNTPAVPDPFPKVTEKIVPLVAALGESMQGTRKAIVAIAQQVYAVRSRITKTVASKQPDPKGTKTETVLGVKNVKVLGTDVQVHDWNGTSLKYALWFGSYVKPLIEKSVPAEDLNSALTKLQNAVSDVVRTKAPKEELVHLGMSTVTRAEQMAALQARRAAAAATGTTPDSDRKSDAVFTSDLVAERVEELIRDAVASASTDENADKINEHVAMAEGLQSIALSFQKSLTGETIAALDGGQRKAIDTHCKTVIATLSEIRQSIENAAAYTPPVEQPEPVKEPVAA